MNDNNKSPGNGNGNGNSNGNGNGNGNGNAALAFIAGASTQIIPRVFADWNVHKSMSDTKF